MDETIKTYTEITPLDGLKMLVENEGLPVVKVAMRDELNEKWTEMDLLGVKVGNTTVQPFQNVKSWKQCAKVTEIDPNKSPHGCPELEPWMAYVGMGALSPIIPPSATLENGDNPYFCVHKGDEHFYETDGSFDKCHHFIDVRTEWAQEHFPEHCRIRNYQEPDAFEEWFVKNYLGVCISHNPYTKHLMRKAYELGQANAK